MLNAERKGKWYEITIPSEWANLNLEKLFKCRWESPKKMTHEFRSQKKVLINGQSANWLAPLNPGEKLQISFFNEETSTVTPTYINVPILFEDDHFICFNKPAFMKTHPNESETDTLQNAAMFHQLSNGDVGNIRPIHRLDRDTSGAILFAKHSLAGAILDRALEKREIKRTYLALIHGFVNPKKGTIQAPIGRDRHHPTRRRVSPSGQMAVTHYQILMEDKEKKLSLVKCWLETGRTHQIRAHLSHIGHPLAGDILYGGKPIFPRQALHAAKLELIHPFTKEKIACYAPFQDAPPIFTNFDVNKL